MKAGIAEMQEELPKVTINFVPSLMGERAHDIYISAEQTRNNENVFIGFGPPKMQYLQMTAPLFLLSQIFKNLFL